MANPIFRITGRDDTAAAWASAQRTAAGGIGSITRLIPGLSAALTTAGLVAFAKQALDSADQLYKLSQRTGIAVEELSALKFAGSQADVEIETLANGIKKLSQNVFEATDAGSTQALTFQQIGVAATDANGKIRPTRDLLLDMADRFSKMDAGATKTALAVKVFGKTGDELIPFLNLGREGIARLTLEAERLGLIMSTDSAAAAEKFNDNMAVLKSTAASLGVTLVTDYAPALSRISGAMRDALQDHGALYAIWVAMGGVLSESLGLGMKESAERARELTRELNELARVQLQLNAADLSPDARKREQASLDAKVAAARKELEALRKQIAAETEAARARDRNDRKIDEDLEQKQKDRKAADAFIATLRREADTWGLSKDEIVKYNAAIEAAKLATPAIAAGLRAETAALVAKIAAQRQAGAETEATLRIEKEQAVARDKAIDAVIAEIETMQAGSAAWDQSNEDRRKAALLADLVATGVHEESVEYRNLEAALNEAAGKLEYYNQLKVARDTREGGLKSLQQEIETLRFETATLTLNNDQRQRALALRQLFAAGVGIDDPQGAELMGEFDEAQAANAQARRQAEADAERMSLDEKAARLIQSFATEEEIERQHYERDLATLDQARATGLLKEQQWQQAKEQLQTRHSSNLLKIKNQETARLQAIWTAARKGELSGMSALFGEAVPLMQAGSRKLFEIGKAAALAQATVNMFASIQSALAVQPFFPVGLAMAALAAAKGIINIQGIRNANFSGGGAAAGTVGTFSASPSTGLPASTAPTSSFEAPQSPFVQAAPVMRKDIHITFTGSGRYTQEEIRDALIPALKEAYGDGVTI